jgi:VIT1/CCC1 family predicted Fe2+/Mn2+ transporter
MAASNYLGTKAELDDWRSLEEVENRHIDLSPEGEREEVRQIFALKGFEGPDLDKVVSLMTATRERWIRTMLTHEYGLPHEVRSPWTAAICTFTAFLACGLIPLLPYLLSNKHSLWLSVGLTAIVFVVIGSVKSRWSTASWWRSGLTTLLVGAIAALLAYATGVTMRYLVD